MKTALTDSCSRQQARRLDSAKKRFQDASRRLKVTGVGRDDDRGRRFPPANDRGPAIASASPRLAKVALPRATSKCATASLQACSFIVCVPRAPPVRVTSGRFRARLASENKSLQSDWGKIVRVIKMQMGFIRSVKLADTPAESKGSTRESAMVTICRLFVGTLCQGSPRVAKSRPWFPSRIFAC
jgi:hypothetical protein